ncbi:MAG: zinc ABC transporter substrate-binding protein [Hyphomicrobiaceae bacterium]|nr:zinc ABC transporter substrate-binding protein [Hyphomicrobiaceae bacterium]
MTAPICSATAAIGEAEVDPHRAIARFAIALALISAFTTLVFGFQAAAYAAGSISNPAAAETKLQAVATTGMIADIVRNVGGERVAVRQLMGEGVDPHLYKATRSDMAAILNADITFFNGLLLEGKMSDALERIGQAGHAVHAVSALLPRDQLLASDDAPGGHADPHVWMDPLAWAKAVAVVSDRLAERDPEGADDYRRNAERYEQKLRDLDRYAEAAIASVPEGRRVLVTAHDAFGYLGRRYGLEVIGIQGLSTESEAGLKRVEEIVHLIATRRIPAVFVESTIPDRSVRALIAGAAARGHAVKIGGELYSDAMGPPGSYEGTYIGMIDHNVTLIARALGGVVPDKGHGGKLAAIVAR